MNERAARALQKSLARKKRRWEAGGRQGILGVSSGVDFDLSTTGHRLGFYAQGVRSNGYSSDKGGLRAFSIGASYSFR